MSVLIHEVPLRESGHYVGLYQPQGVKCLASICAFQKWIEIIQIHFSTSSFYITASELINVSVQFCVCTKFTCWWFSFQCLHSVSFFQNYLQPKEHWQTKRLNFFTCTFLFLYLSNSIWAHFFYLDDLTSIRRRLEENWDPDQLWKTECQVNCLVIQWCMQPASSEAPVSTMTSLTSELCGLVLGEVPWRRPSVRDGGGGSEALWLTWMRPAGNEDKAVNDPFVPWWNELLENVLVTKTVVWSEWAWWSQEFLKTFI